MRAAVIINQHARRVRNQQNFAAELQRCFQAHSVDAVVECCRQKDLRRQLQEAIRHKPDAIISVGGDGTASTIAETCLDHGLPLGVVPAGTHNHFAKDLQIPEDTDEAVRCIAAGNLTTIDVGDVNGRPFINNSSVGAYPRALEERDRLIERFGMRKSLAQMVATLRVFACRPLVRAEIEIDGTTEFCETPFVFVGNNDYKVRPLEPRFRTSLNAGQLCVFTSRRVGVGGFFRLIWLSLLNRLDGAAEFQTRFGKSASVRLIKNVVRVSKDGEVLHLQTPLHFSVRRHALQVFAPIPCAA